MRYVFCLPFERQKNLGYMSMIQQLHRTGIPGLARGMLMSNCHQDRSDIEQLIQLVVTQQTRVSCEETL